MSAFDDLKLGAKINTALCGEAVTLINRAIKSLEGLGYVPDDIHDIIAAVVEAHEDEGMENADDSTEN